MSRGTKWGQPNKTKDHKIMFLHKHSRQNAAISQSNAVYKFTYSGCNSLYIGKTNRTLLVRTQEHAFSDCPSTGLASSSNMSEKALSRRTAFTTEFLLNVVAGNFAPSLSIKFLSNSVHISDSTEPIAHIWVSLKSYFPLADLKYK